MGKLFPLDAKRGLPISQPRVPARFSAPMQVPKANFGFFGNREVDKAARALAKEEAIAATTDQINANRTLREHAYRLYTAGMTGKMSLEATKKLGGLYREFNSEISEGTASMELDCYQRTEETAFMLERKEKELAARVERGELSEATAMLLLNEATELAQRTIQNDKSQTHELSDFIRELSRRAIQSVKRLDGKEDEPQV